MTIYMQKSPINTPISVLKTYQQLLACSPDQPHKRQCLALAGQVMDGYANLDAQGKQDFFKTVAQQNLWRHNGLYLLHAPKNHTIKLINMRRDLLDCIKHDTNLAPLDLDFKAFLQNLFREDSLRFERIVWHTTPQATLEKLIEYEAVHQMDGWKDLENRLIWPDRLMYAVFHPLTGDEPLIFTEVALMQGMPNHAPAILSQDRPILAPSITDTAVFYGLSKSHRGLVGIPFGRLLLQHTLHTIRAEFDHVNTFVTLSPIPGLVDWTIAQLDDPNSILSPSELDMVRALQNSPDTTTMAQVVRDNSPLVKKIIARYITSHNPNTHSKGAVNYVAHFHLSNGAELYEIQILADQQRMRQSYGCMVNYRYDVNIMAKNRDNYCHYGKIALSYDLTNMTERQSEENNNVHQ